MTLDKRITSVKIKYRICGTCAQFNNYERGKALEFKEMITLLQNTGVTIVVVAYFMMRDYKFMSTLQEALTTLIQTVDTLKDMMEK